MRPSSLGGMPLKGDFKGLAEFARAAVCDRAAVSTRGRYSRAVPEVSEWPEAPPWRRRLKGRAGFARAAESTRGRYSRAVPERCPSGLRSATGNRVRAERCVAGSNPALSAPGRARFRDRHRPVPVPTTVPLLALPERDCVVPAHDECVEDDDRQRLAGQRPERLVRAADEPELD